MGAASTRFNPNNKLVSRNDKGPAREDKVVQMARETDLLRVEDMRVTFRLPRGTVEAVRGASLRVLPGKVTALVGESGSGKSILSQTVMGLQPNLADVSGKVLFADGDGALPRDLLALPKDGRAMRAIRGGRIGMIFQDPASSLNPVHRVGKQIAEALRLHRGITGTAARAEAKRLFDLVGIPDAERRLDAYPHEFSGGQNQRVMIAMALAGQPDLLVADEPTTALDVTIQAQILELLQALRREFGMTLVLISHDLGVVAETCERVCVMYAGRIVEEAPTHRLFAHAAHPYTQGLLGALPPITGPRRRLSAIPGGVPEPWAMPPGCAFAPRCNARMAACDAGTPARTELVPGHGAACLRAVAPEYAEAVPA